MTPRVIQRKAKNQPSQDHLAHTSTIGEEEIEQALSDYRNGILAL